MSQDLMRGGSDLMSLAMLATRAQSATRRATEASPITGDLEVLQTLAGKLDAVALSIQFFDSRGQAGSVPVGAVAAQVEVTIETVVHEHAGDADRQRVADELHRLAEVARGLPNDRSHADDLNAFCAGLAGAVLRQTRSVGEVTAAL
ncbi:MAG: hypothetical protein JWP74_1517 [Marmoricola sp.]|nr:hypothetical protein [Marmoricola sp.]